MSFNTTLTALWQVLDADTALTTIMGSKGSKYKFAAADLLHKLDFEPHNCPIIAVAPSPAGSAWREARTRSSSGAPAGELALDVELVTSGHAVANILALADAFQAAIEADLAAASSKLAAQLVDTIEYSGLEYVGVKDNLVIEIWTCRVSMTVKYRQR